MPYKPSLELGRVPPAKAAPHWQAEELECIPRPPSCPGTDATDLAPATQMCERMPLLSQNLSLIVTVLKPVTFWRTQAAERLQLKRLDQVL